MNVAALSIALFATLISSAMAEPIGICHGGDRAARKVTCLVDGDTGWEAGVKWRLKDVDTPEYPPQARCASEVEMAKSATYRMLELMRGGYSIVWLHQKDRTRDKRELVRIGLRDGRDAGEVLISERFAIAWPNAPDAFCHKAI